MSSGLLSGLSSAVRSIDERLSLAKAYVSSAVLARRHERFFDQVERYCMFVGYPRSGHSLVGALLTGHPNFVISHELDALKYVRAGFSRDQLFALILQKDREFIRSGGEWTGYDYALPGTSQGEFRELTVIGDKKGGSSSLDIATDPSLLPRLKKLVNLELRLIHVTRNPYDNIATMQKKRLRPLSEIIERFFVHCRGSALATEFAGTESTFTFRHEQLIAEPRTVVRQLCEFLGRPASDSYLDACASRIFESPRKTRFEVSWSQDDRKRVEMGMRDFPSLHGYTFDA